MAVFHEVGDEANQGAGRQPKLLDQVRGRMRRLGMARRSEEAYVGWIRRFILSNGKRHPASMGTAKIERFLTSLAVERKVAASTQNQALSALLFLYRQVLGVELPWLDGIERAKKPQRLPVVLAREETTALLGEMSGVHWLMASLFYGTDMRLMECLRLRVKDVDFERGEILVREGKGGKDRRTMLPRSLVDPLRAQLAEAARVHERDRQRDSGGCGCRGRWRASIRARRWNGAGSTFFRRRRAAPIGTTGCSGGIIWMNPRCSVR